MAPNSKWQPTKFPAPLQRLRKKRGLLFLLVVIAIILLVGTGTFLLARGGGNNSTSSQSTRTNSATTVSNANSTTTNASFPANATTSKSSSINSGPAQRTYLTSSAPNSSQWLIIQSLRIPSSVSSNNSGSIPQYSSLAELNTTKIGEFCEAVSPGGTMPDIQNVRANRLVLG